MLFVAIILLLALLLPVFNCGYSSGLWDAIEKEKREKEEKK